MVESDQKSNSTLYLLLGAFAFALGWALSKVTSEKRREAVHPQDHTNEKGDRCLVESAVISQVAPSPIHRNQPNRGEEHTPRWKKIGEWSIACATLGLFVVAILQFCLTRKQVRIGQRAYLVLHHAVLEGELKADKSISGTLDLTNSGLTPAKNVSYFIELDIWPGYPTAMCYPNELIPAAPIGANEKLRLYSQMLTRLSAEDAKEIAAEPMLVEPNKIVIPTGKHLYLRAIARYETVFGDHGEAEFCGVYLQSRNEFIGCPTHNGLK